MKSRQKIFLGLGILFSILAIVTAVILVPPLLELNRIFQEYQKAYGDKVMRDRITGELVIVPDEQNNFTDLLENNDRYLWCARNTNMSYEECHSLGSMK
jgi:hypothetical protein